MKTAVLCMLLSLFAGRALGQEPCTPASLNGSYGYMFSGFLLIRSGTALSSIVGSGKLVFDGAQGVVADDIVSQDGVVTGRRNLTGSYRLSSDCTGGIVIHDAKGGRATLQFTMVDNGKTLLFVQSDQTAVITGSARRQFNAPEPCQLPPAPEPVAEPPQEPPAPEALRP